MCKMSVHTFKVDIMTGYASQNKFMGITFRNIDDLKEIVSHHGELTLVEAPDSCVLGTLHLPTILKLASFSQKLVLLIQIHRRAWESCGFLSILNLVGIISLHFSESLSSLQEGMF